MKDLNMSNVKEVEIWVNHLSKIVRNRPKSFTNVLEDKWMYSQCVLEHSIMLENVYSSPMQQLQVVKDGSIILKIVKLILLVGKSSNLWQLRNKNKLLTLISKDFQVYKIQTLNLLRNYYTFPESMDWNNQAKDLWFVFSYSLEIFLSIIMTFSDNISTECDPTKVTKSLSTSIS